MTNSSTEPTPTPAPTTTPEPAPASTLPARSEPKTPVQFGVIPQTIDEAMRLARFIAEGDSKLKGKPYDVLVAMLTGAEQGFSPMQAIASVAVIGGRGSFWGDGMLAIVMRSPQCEDILEFFEVDGQRHDSIVKADLLKDTTAGVCIVKRRGRATPTVSRFTVEDAKTANLWKKSGPWSDYPSRMLKMRARAWALRDTFPDILRGVQMAEELRDVPVDVTPPLDDLVRRTDLHAFVDRTADTRHDDNPEPVEG